MLRGRKKVTWTAGAESRIKQPAPHPYQHPAVDFDAQVESLKEFLVPGTLWLTQCPLGLERPDASVRMHEFPYAYSDHYYPVIPQGSMAIYTGTTRVEEVKRGGIHVRPDRHTFLVGDRRIMVVSFVNLLVPVQSS